MLLVSALMVSLEVGMLSSPSHDDLMAADARDILYRKAKFGIGQFEQTMPPGHAAGYISGSFLVRSYLAIVMHLATIGLGCGLYLGITVFRALGHTDEQIKVEQRWTLTGCIVGMIVFMFVGNILMFLMIASFVQVKWPLYGASSNFDHATGAPYHRLPPPCKAPAHVYTLLTLTPARVHAGPQVPWLRSHIIRPEEPLWTTRPLPSVPSEAS